MRVILTGLVRRPIAKFLCSRQVTNFSLDQVNEIDAEQPFDYVNRRYTAWNRLFYKTLGNVGDNTLSVTVEGNYGTRRSYFAKTLAKIINFLYVPPPDVDRMYYQRGRHNLRKIWNDCVLPDKRAVNWEEWLLDCDIHNTIHFQYYATLTSAYQYRMALIHLLSTGQGVLFDGSYWSQRVFAKALHEYGLIDDAGLEAYDEIRQLYDCELKRPHLVVYIERPVQECLRDIQESNGPESKCKLFQDTKYLALVEKWYEDEFLKPISDEASHVLRYKFDDVVDHVQIIAEDMEYINFEDKCFDWKVTYSSQLDDYREHISREASWERMERKLRKKRYVPQLVTLGEEAVKIQRLVASHPDTIKARGADLPYLEQLKMYWGKLTKGGPPRPFY